MSAEVTQGYILGPLLFICYVNDLQYNSNIVQTIQYADDSSQDCRSSTISFLNHSRDRLKEEAFEYFTSYKLCWIHNNTVCMYVSIKNNQSENQDHTEYSNFLSMCFGNKLNQNPDIFIAKVITIRNNYSFKTSLSWGAISVSVGKWHFIMGNATDNQNISNFKWQFEPYPMPDIFCKIEQIRKFILYEAYGLDCASPIVFEKCERELDLILTHLFHAKLFSRVIRVCRPMPKKVFKTVHSNNRLIALSSSHK